MLHFRPLKMWLMTDPAFGYTPSNTRSFDIRELVLLPLDLAAGVALAVR